MTSFENNPSVKSGYLSTFLSSSLKEIITMRRIIHLLRCDNSQFLFPIPFDEEVTRRQLSLVTPSSNAHLRLLSSLTITIL